MSCGSNTSSVFKFFVGLFGSVQCVHQNTVTSLRCWWWFMPQFSKYIGICDSDPYTYSSGINLEVFWAHPTLKSSKYILWLPRAPLLLSPSEKTKALFTHISYNNAEQRRRGGAGPSGYQDIHISLRTNQTGMFNSAFLATTAVLLPLALCYCCLRTSRETGAN